MNNTQNPNTHYPSGKRKPPFSANPKAARRAQRFYRLQRKGLAPNLTKSERKAEIDQLVAEHRSRFNRPDV